MAFPITSPVVQFFDLDGSPLDAGYLYFGTPQENPETSPVTVYWDEAGTQPAQQPIRTMNGYPVRAGKIAPVFVDDNCSITVRNKTMQLVLYDAAVLAGAVDFIYQNYITISRNTAISPLKNGMSAGPIIILDGVTVTIPTASAWSIV